MIRERALVAEKKISDKENQKHRGVPTLQVSLDNADVVIDRMTEFAGAPLVLTSPYALSPVRAVREGR